MSGKHEAKRTKSGAKLNLVPPTTEDKAAEIPVQNVQVLATHVPNSSGLQTYGRDLFERWILFLDTLRQRSENMVEHERQGMPRCCGSPQWETIAGRTALMKPSPRLWLSIHGPDTAPASVDLSATVKSVWRCTKGIRSISSCFIPNQCRNKHWPMFTTHCALLWPR
jgi:hypothetical protein